MFLLSMTFYVKIHNCSILLVYQFSVILARLSNKCCNGRAMHDFTRLKKNEEKVNIQIVGNRHLMKLLVRYPVQLGT